MLSLVMVTHTTHTKTPSYDLDFPQISGTPVLSRRGSPSVQESSRRGTPSVPPGFEAEAISRRGTPTIPPGFSRLPNALPTDLEGPAGLDRVIGRPAPEGTPSRTASRVGLKRVMSGQVVPVLPLRPGTPGRTMSRTASRAVSRAGSPVKREEQEEVATKAEAVEETPTKKPKAVVPRALEKEKEVVKPEAKENEKPVIVKTEEKKEVVVPAAKTNEKVVDSKEFAAQVKTALTQPPNEVEQVIKSAKDKAAVLPEPKAPAVPAAQLVVEAKPAVETKPTPVTPSKADNKADATKRKHPGKLDITAAVEKQQASVPATAATPVETSTPGKQPKSVTQTPSIVDSPSTNAPSPVVKTAPRTLRVVQTPKTDAPPPTPPAAAPALPTPAESMASKRLPSRQPSVASMNLPGTPTSELISDNISMTSTSLSRANSPPPPGAGKVGSAPVRTKTKAQQRKDRKAYAQAIEEEKARLDAEDNPVEEEVAQEAIVSRKKKERKAKPGPVQKAKGLNEAKATNTMPTASRPASPGPSKEKVVIPEAVAKAVASKPATPTKASQPQPAQQIPQPPQQPTRELSPPPTPTLSPAQIIADLRQANPGVQKALESLFRTSSTANLKPAQAITPKDLVDPTTWNPDFNIKLTQDEILGLLSGKIPAVQYGGGEGRQWDRGLVTPSGAHLRALSQELENRFLELERVVRQFPEELRFHPTKPQNETKLPGFDLQALRAEFEGRGVSVMEAMVQDGSGMKKGAFLVDEAGRYVNEFVMPPATPPPNHVAVGNGQVGGPAGIIGGPVGGQTAGGAQVAHTGPNEAHVLGVEIAERQLQEARRAADEKEGALRRVIRRNKKMLGLG